PARTIAIIGHRYAITLAWAGEMRVMAMKLNALVPSIPSTPATSSPGDRGIMSARLSPRSTRSTARQRKPTAIPMDSVWNVGVGEAKMASDGHTAHRKTDEDPIKVAWPGLRRHGPAVAGFR